MRRAEKSLRIQITWVLSEIGVVQFCVNDLSAIIDGSPVFKTCLNEGCVPVSAAGLLVQVGDYRQGILTKYILFILFILVLVSFVALLWPFCGSVCGFVCGSV